MRENRGHERIILDGDVYLRSMDGKPSEAKVFLDNFCFGGIAVYSAEKLELGSILEFALITKVLDEALACKGKVRHVTLPPYNSRALYTVGIEFMEVNSDLVVHMLARIQARNSRERQAQKQAAPKLDYIPF